MSGNSFSAAELDSFQICIAAHHEYKFAYSFQICIMSSFLPTHGVSRLVATISDDLVVRNKGGKLRDKDPGEVQ